jgi:hypothetical protein
MPETRFNNLPYDIHLKIANAAVEDFVDDSLPFLPLRLICSDFTPIISQAIMNQWAQSNPSFHVLADTHTDRLVQMDEHKMRNNESHFCWRQDNTARK